MTQSTEAQAPQHPMQPLITDDGFTRFHKNQIVNYLLQHGGLSLNDLGKLPFSDQDWSQFYQLTGYSVEGWQGQPFVTPQAAHIAAEAAVMFEAGQPLPNKLQAAKLTIEALEAQVEAMRTALATVYETAEAFAD